MKVTVYASTLLLPAMASAQSVSVSHCNYIHIIGDTLGENHRLSNNSFSCRIEGGLLDKGAMTGQVVYEFKGAQGVGKAGYGITRTEDATVLWVTDEAKVELKMKDGKVVGWTNEGTGHYVAASGKAKDLVGKSYTFTAEPTGPSQFDIKTTVK